MDGSPITLDARRAAAELRNIAARRRLKQAKDDQAAIKIDEEDVEALLKASPAATLLEAAAKAKYLIQLFAQTSEAHQPGRQALIADSLNEIDRLFSMSAQHQTTPKD